MATRSQRCTRSPKWLLPARNSSRVFNFLEWSGTSMLAYDIEAFRKAVCAERMHINGGSYGTAVGATYATKFPASVGQVMLNGCMPAVPETQSFAEGQGTAMTQSFTFLKTACALDTTTEPCKSYSEADVGQLWDLLMAELRAGRLAAPTEDGTPFALSIGLLQGYLQAQMIAAGFAPVGWRDPVLTLSALTSTNASTRQAMVATILDAFCVLPTVPGYNWSGVITWAKYGVCIGPQSVGVSSFGSNAEGFLTEATVLGQDYFGRFEVPQAMGIWRRFVDTWGEMATSSFVGIFSTVFAWGALPTPSPTTFREGVPALVIGNLHDPATSYYWTNTMRQGFPDGRLMIWQGVGHMLTARADYANSGMRPCLERVAAFWANGTLPVDGFTCRLAAPLPVSENLG